MAALGGLTVATVCARREQSQQLKAAEQERAENARQVANEHAARAEEQSATERDRAERAQQVADKHDAKAEHRQTEEWKSRAPEGGQAHGRGVWRLTRDPLASVRR